MKIKNTGILVLAMAVMTVQGCGDTLAGLASGIKELGIDEQATIPDSEKANETFESVFPQVQDAVGQALSQGMSAAGGMKPQQAAGNQSFDIDETISEDGATMTVKGTVNISATPAGALSQEQDLRVTWSGIKATVDGSDLDTSGKVVLSGSLEIGTDQSITGTFEQIGQITVGGETFGFDIVTTFSGTKITITGTINGETTETTIDLAEAGQSSGSDGSSNGTTDTTDGDDSSVTKVTLGVYTDNGDGTYNDTGKDLVIEVGVECFTWTRTAQADSTVSTSHDHYNAADDSSYVDGVVTWTEYGPEHSQSDIDATCAAGTGGATKTADSTSYTQDKNFYLKIKSVE